MQPKGPNATSAVDQVEELFKKQRQMLEKKIKATKERIEHEVKKRDNAINHIKTLEENLKVYQSGLDKFGD